MLQLIIFLSLIAASAASCNHTCDKTMVQASAASCNRTCGKTRVQYPFGFSPSCHIPLSCNSNSGISFSDFPVQNFSTNYTFSVNISANCARPVSAASSFFSTNYALTHRNGLFLRNCDPSSKQTCLLPTLVVSQMSHQLQGCGQKDDNITCIFNNRGNEYLTKDYVVNGSSCTNLFTSILYEPYLAGQTVLVLGVVEIGWWMTGECRCAANATCSRLGNEVKDGYWCKCNNGFVGDGFADGDGCRREPSKCKLWGCGHNQVGAIIGGIVVGGALATGLFFLCIIYRRRYGKPCSLNEYQITTQRILSEISCTLPIYSYREIERATNSFAETNKLGTGGYGTVYIGKLLLQHNSTDDLVAIKRLRYRSDSDSINQLTNEIKLISSVSHPNLVRLLGCCIDNGEQILIYEYMPNGTLAQHLRPDHGRNALSWSVRLSIATETAKAIAYLHNSIHPPIYHRDIKSSNILLDRDFNAKVADFGLSRAGLTELSHISTAPQGTPGYLDPEYHQNFHLSDKSDVYSFGVVLIEIITAMKVVDFSRGSTEVNLASLAVDRIGRGRIEEIVDPFLLNSSSVGDDWVMVSVRKLAELAFRCLAFSKDVRPCMSEVAGELEFIWASAPESGPLDAKEDMDKNEEEKVLMSNSNARRKREQELESPVSVQYMWISENSSFSTNGSMPRFV
ncbi:Wall-associated kinase family protein [Rhynchospora pubera]|uniref:Wall-associated kinase family protein n=1 Tax=Rhynchospora pubera TaxID=906938 RepID=A0AAV8ERL7_9POAL|nr:Wall-associated kinase family protein [Rhynchospora pubera]